MLLPKTATLPKFTPIKNQFKNSNQMKKNAFILLLLFPFLSIAQIQTPAEFLGYELGEEFTYHHKMIQYFQEVADKSDLVEFQIYGKTYERRELGVAFVSSAENIKNLDQIRKNNLISAGLAEGEMVGKQLPIVWLSYNVHGNEAVSMETAMKVLHYLVANADKSKDWLNNLIIAIDPCENPDGRERYAQFYNQTGNRTPNANIDSWEHHENWPSGRVNHYCFDLNRDWLWQTQVESQQRTEIYQKWMPQIHVDLHEMGVNTSYFFPPAAEPFHKSMTDWQREFHQIAGKNHAKYFDANGWLYFTKETFDLLYPSYGDTWPTFNGAIGFTYEQAGSGQAGVAVKTVNLDTLTLADRISHHFATSISTIEASYVNQAKLLANFNDYFQSGSTQPVGKYKSYVVKSTDSNAKTMEALAKLLAKQQIKFGYAKSTSKKKGFSYFDNSDKDFTVSRGDLIVPTNQPKHHLIDVLFEQEPELSDSLTYDMTAWALPYVFGLETFGTSTQITNLSFPTVGFPPLDYPNANPSGKKYAYLATWNDVVDVKFLSEVLQAGIKARIAKMPFKMDGKSYKAGTLIFTRFGNTSVKGGFENRLIEIANSNNKQLFPTQSGMVESGKDFGSGNVQLLKTPKVAIVGGNGVSQTHFGETWHYFDQTIQYPTTILNTNYLKRVDLKEYDVLVLPSGNYSSFDTQITAFVTNGGKLILLDKAVKTLKGSLLTRKKKEMDSEADSKNLLNIYGNQQRNSLVNSVEGSIYKVLLDKTHPLAFGISDDFYLPKRNNQLFNYLSKGWNVGYYEQDSYVAGFVGSQLKPQIPNSLAFGVENMGKGKIIYMPDSPIFRGFWHSGLLVMGNAVFFD
ncbi:MAG: hypothetical protein ACJAWV_003088 [Flammeovirgaceae bacterium]|jgi:hypothetical protein